MAADDEDKPKKKSKLKLLIILLVLLGLIGGGSYGAWHFFLADMFKSKFGGGEEVAVSGPATHQEMPPGPAPMGATVALPTFTVNLADPLGQRYIKVSLEVELADPRTSSEIERHSARIKDSIIMLLSSKTYADLATTESKIMLKSEIAQRLNAILGPGRIYEVYITDMVIQ